MGWLPKSGQVALKLRTGGSATPEYSLAEFPYLFGDRQALPKTPEKTEMVLRFPLGFA